MSFVASVESSSSMQSVKVPSNSPDRETVRVESPDSARDMGNMRTRPILPAPLCLGPSLSLRLRREEEPVRIHPP